MLKSLDTIDRTILLWMHGKHNSIFDQLMPFITNEDNWIIPIFLLIVFLGFKAGKKGKISLALLILALALTDSICAQILKPLFERVRPSHLSMDGLNLLVPKGGKWSMPSNHAANIFSLAVVLSYFYNRMKIPLFVLASLIALSRVYVGVHYPSDVIVGGLLGYAIGWFTITLWVILKIRELKRRQTWVWYETEPPVFKN
jgi:undecaprenyl-diphosphatase